MENVAHDIILFEKYHPFPERLPEFLHTKGFASQVAVNIKDLIAATRRLKDPIILIQCEKEEKKCAKDLLSNNHLYHVPIILFGACAYALTDLLQKNYKLIKTLHAAPTNSDMLSAIHETIALYEKEKAKYLNPNLAEKSVNTSPLGLPIDEKEPTRSGHHLFRKFSSIPELVFDHINDLGLAKLCLKGEDYAKTKINEDFLKENDFIPSNEKQRELAEQVLKQSDKWSKLHICRTAYIAAQFASSHASSQQIINDIKLSALLYSCALVDGEPSLLRDNYLRVTRQSLRKDICSRLKDSAMKISVELQAPKITNIIATMGRIIGKEQFAGEDEVSLISSMLVAADLIDRVCYQNGSWNPRAANTLLRRLKSGSITELHPYAICCMVKFLGEAISSKICKFILLKQLKADPQMLEKIQHLLTQEAGTDEEKVSIDALVPGMRLSRPLHAYDGREILSEGMTLDQDLIWRLWQLAAVRPLIQHLIIQTKQ